MPVLNLSNVKQSSFEPVPAGIYNLEVVEAEERVGNESGKPYLNVQFAVTADNEDYANRRIFMAMTYDEESAWALVQFLKALGYTDEELTAVEIDDEFFTNIVGSEVTAQVAIKKQQGYEDKNVVKKFILPEVEVG